MQTTNINLPHCPANNSCVVCRSSSGQRKHVVVYRIVIADGDPIKPFKNTESFYDTCLIHMKSVAGIKSQLRVHRAQNETEGITGEVKVGKVGIV